MHNCILFSKRNTFPSVEPRFLLFSLMMDRLWEKRMEWVKVLDLFSSELAMKQKPLWWKWMASITLSPPFLYSVINGKPIKLSYASARRWLRDDEAPKVGSGNDSKYDVILEGPEIPNIRPPPPTPSMIAKSMVSSATGSTSVVDAYGNSYENPIFSYDPVFRVVLYLSFDVSRLWKQDYKRRCESKRRLQQKRVILKFQQIDSNHWM